MMNMNISRYLYVFNYVLANGTKRQGKFHFGELSAWHDFDGYSCYIGYKDLTMGLYFHSRFDFDYQKKATLKDFKLLIDKMTAELKVKG